MHRLITVAVAGLAAGWLTLATPSTSQAQGISFGLQFQRGGYGYGPPSGFYQGGYGGRQPFYGNQQFYGGNQQFYGGNGYGGRGFYPQGPVIVHPEFEHWTPGRGWHEHGHIHVPHWGHSHTRRY